PPMSTPAGFARESVAAAHAVIEAPLIAYGRIRTPEMAAEILAAGEADLVGVARALITDPRWVRKAKEGAADRIRLCIGCNQGCLDRLWLGRQITCILNPAAGREARFGESTLEPAAAAERVLVVGGGPAGMKTAEVAARRGHEVTLVEGSDRLGGAVNILGRAPGRGDFLDSVRWLENEIRLLGVDVHLSQHLDLADFETGEDGRVRVGLGADEPADFDAVVLATGASASIPAVPGADSAGSVRVEAVLEGRAEVGDRVVIVDSIGSFAAVSTANMLAAEGRQVTLVSQATETAARLGPPDRQIQMTKLFENGVELVPGCALTEIALPTVRFANVLSGDPVELEADTVVLATGWVSDGTDFDGLDRIVESLHRVGDCVAPRDVGMAIYTAEELGRAI
ncbi:MAG TPA: FAD-dependent oxidoreductase, partial [Solirubrobacterales bacterium]